MNAGVGPDGFKNFLADLGERPRRNTLDRINVDGNCEPGNCQWATNKEQTAYRHSSKEYEAEHATPEQDLAAITGIETII